MMLGVGMNSMNWVRGTLGEPGFDEGGAVRPQATGGGRAPAVGLGGWRAVMSPPAADTERVVP